LTCEENVRQRKEAVQQDVLDELRSDPAVNAADVGVTDPVDRLVVSY
jgi:hypothetical protein